MTIEKAIFAAGCFWSVEELFRKLPGVIKTVVGYTGGKVTNPTYERVCSDTTGHAEAVQIEYDPEVIVYEELLKIFWDNHNPTTLNHQGPDIGTQYRSAIFYFNDEQKQAALKSKSDLELAGKWPNPIVTEIKPAKDFWPAEDYHQKYLMNRGLESCHV